MKSEVGKARWLQWGFMELAAYAKFLFETEKQDEWNPFPEKTSEQIRDLCRSFLHADAGENVFSDEPGKRLLFLRQKFALSDKEFYIVCMAGLTEMDEGFTAVYEILGSESGEAEYPILEKVWSFCHDEEESEAFVRWGLLRRFFLETRKRREELVLKKRFPEFIEQGKTDSTPGCLTDGSQMDSCVRQTADKICTYLKNGLNRGKKECLMLLGPDGTGKKECIVQAAYSLGWRIIFEKERTLTKMEEHERDVLLREAILNDACLCVELEEKKEDDRETDTGDFYETLLHMTPVLFFVGKADREMGLSVPPLVIHFALPDMEESRQIWEKVLSEYPGEHQLMAGGLSVSYRLSAGQIRRISELAWKKVRYEGRDSLTLSDLQEACHNFLHAGFDGLAVRIRGGGSWADLILPERQKRRLREVCYQLQYRHRVMDEWNLKERMPYGTGISLVFSGPPGTGKTMAAGILAGKLGVELYRVSLPAVVSKYIGETEKNLQEIFEKAEKSQAALFFDEADVLFGKRTEVKEANDKYSNLEAAFLLQRMEEFDGITILATNLLKNMDEAFRRRMKLIIEFPFPDKEQRLELWKRSIPEAMPTEGLDLEFLAERFELSGSEIRNVIYQAAFLAAAEDGALTMHTVMRAVAGEYEKNGKVLSRQEAGMYGMDVEGFR